MDREYLDVLDRARDAEARLRAVPDERKHAVAEAERALNQEWVDYLTSAKSEEYVIGWMTGLTGLEEDQAEELLDRLSMISDLPDDVRASLLR